MVRHIRRGYDGSDENPVLMRWTIPAALMYCITIYTTIGESLGYYICPLAFYSTVSDGHVYCCDCVGGEMIAASRIPNGLE